ncbi:uncharacterized protein F5891DRAFT_919298, partial [Suillus fuscotomentosus]
VSFQTLHDRATRRHQSIQSAARKRQLLSPSQEAALLDWCHLNSSFTTPLHAHAFRTRVFEICHRRPGHNWVRHFICRHPCLVMAKPRGLDPKRAQNFNRKTVGDYFNMRKEVDDRCNKIPPEHNWNMDEKGNQMGGGRKGDGTKYIFWIEDKERYCMYSDNLELVTILECVNAAG